MSVHVLHPLAEVTDDTREVTPSEVVTMLNGAVEDGNADEIVVIMAGKDGTMRMIVTDMTNTELMGFVMMGLLNYSHCVQHADDLE